jgi:hypothetical protein
MGWAPASQAPAVIHSYLELQGIINWQVTSFIDLEGPPSDDQKLFGCKYSQGKAKCMIGFGSSICHHNDSEYYLCNHSSHRRLSKLA